MKLIRIVKRFVHNSDKTVAMLADLAKLSERAVVGIENQSSLLNDKLMEVIDKLMEIIDRQDAEISALRKLLELSGGDFSTIQTPPLAAKKPTNRLTEKPPSAPSMSLESALASFPLMIDAKTYNTAHPDYDAALARNFAGKIFNANAGSNNPVYTQLKKLAKNNEIPSAAWNSILRDALDEAKTVPHAGQIFERRAYIEEYLRQITEKNNAIYSPGWVNLDDAVFLYWLVRQLKPKTIVQTGVCNGLSSAFMVLGLAKNGAEGRLRAVDLPPVFNSKDPAWTVRGKVYGVVIPEGKSSGWIVPDAYQDRFEVWSGDAKTLLPNLIDDLDSVDLFYHDSDHTYDHMMFEFDQAKRKLRPGGIIVGDDVAWNASLWDFADRYGVPGYNFRGTMGLAFF